jgi:hypothetical protein
MAKGVIKTGAYRCNTGLSKSHMPKTQGKVSCGTMKSAGKGHNEKLSHGGCCVGSGDKTFRSGPMGQGPKKID